MANELEELYEAFKMPAQPMKDLPIPEDAVPEKWMEPPTWEWARQAEGELCLVHCGDKWKVARLEGVYPLDQDALVETPRGSRWVTSPLWTLRVLRRKGGRRAETD